MAGSKRFGFLAVMLESGDGDLPELQRAIQQATAQLTPQLPHSAVGSCAVQMAVNGDGLSISAVEVVGDHIERLLRATFGFERHQPEIASSLQEHTVAPTRTSTKPPKRRGEMPISPVKCTNVNV